MSDGDDGSGRSRSRLDDLGRRIDAVRAARKPAPREGGTEYSAASLAWRMVTDLVAGIMVGGAIGLGLDVLLGTTPLFLLVVGGLGFVAGIRLVMRAGKQAGEQAEKQARARAGERTRDGTAEAGRADDPTD